MTSDDTKLMIHVTRRLLDASDPDGRLRARVEEWEAKVTKMLASD